MTSLLGKSSFLVICCLVLPSSSFAIYSAQLEKQSHRSYLTGFTLRGYFEAGKRSQAEDFEEEDEDREYTFQNYHLKLKHKLSDRSSYELGSFIYDKDYNSNDSLDNISKIFNTKGSYYLNKRKQESLKLSVKFKYKEKRYRNTPSSEFDQSVLSPKLTYVKKDSYVIDLSAGINNYDYINKGGNDQFKFFSKLGTKRYLLEKKFILSASYKFETAAHKKAHKEKNKNNFMFGVDYIFNSPLIRKITASAEFGQRDTKDDDARDENFDYKYKQFYIKTRHKINPKVKTDLKYTYFKKDYLTADLDHNGFYIHSNWRYKIFTDKTQGVYLNFNAGHKDVNYALKPVRDYKKETLEIKGAYKKNKNWKTSASLERNLYNYKDSTKDKSRFYIRLFFEKLFPERALGLSLNFKHKYTDSKQASDTSEESIRVAFKYKF